MEALGREVGSVRFETLNSFRDSFWGWGEGALDTLGATGYMATLSAACSDLFPLWASGWFHTL